jgi:hypothetical protein
MLQRKHAKHALEKSIAGRETLIQPMTI